MERRMTPGGEIRIIETAPGKQVLTGYGAVFYREGDEGTEYQMFPDLVERIAPTAFTRALKEKHDAAGLFNHDPNMLLGRVAAGTMRLSVDKTGLRYEIDLGDTTAAKDVAANVARGDVTGSSFAFRATKQTWSEQEDGPDVRTIEDVDLYDTGPVVFPAYAGTTTGLRSDDCDEAKRARDAWRQGREALAVEVRMRLLDLDAA